MTLSPENILLIGSILLFISIFASKSSGKFGIPSLLIFLIVGMLAGSEGIGNIHFDDPGLTQFPNLMLALGIDCIEIIFKYFEAVVENLLQFLTDKD